MANNTLKDILSIAFSGGGTAAGLLAGGLTGDEQWDKERMGAGAMIGGSLGGMLSSGIDMFTQPDVSGASEAQKQALGLQGHAVQKMAALQGLSSQDVQNIAQLGIEQKQQMMAQANTMAASLSPLDRQRLLESMTREIGDVNQSISQKIAMLDPGAESRNALMLSKGSAMYGQQAAGVAQAEMVKEQTEMQINRAIQNQFGNNMQNLLNGIFSGMDLMEESSMDSMEESENMSLLGNKKLSDNLSKEFISENKIIKELEENISDGDTLKDFFSLKPGKRSVFTKEGMTLSEDEMTLSEDEIYVFQNLSPEIKEIFR